MSLKKEPFYCVKCRVKKDQVPESVRQTTSNRYMLAVKCSVCGLQQYKFTAEAKVKTKYKDLEIQSPPKKTIKKRTVKARPSSSSRVKSA